ncbi:MAG: nitroreductase [Chloroflexi bacterium]|nr:nitroreductase [Chloroflexota bacterium]HCU74042.1 nitroreductase [Chloroflexota bacterium]|tara:strand:+ start:16178 stop:16771 length:594 start_codon:yes stop_codon:yes gene_type:complete
MDVYTAIHGRRSVSTLAEDVPPRTVIERLINAAVWAPNHHLTEPWRFHVLCGAARSEMGAAVADRLEEELDPADPATSGAIRSARSRLSRAPVVVVVSQNGSDDPMVNLEDYAAVCCATQNLMLAAHAEGLATKWRTGDMCDYRASKEFLGLSEADRIVGYVYVGYPAAHLSSDDRERKSPEVGWLGWDDPSDSVSV